jgi:heme A synthase
MKAAVGSFSQVSAMLFKTTQTERESALSSLYTGFHILAIIVLFIVLVWKRRHKTTEIPPAKAYRLYPDRNHWTRTEMIALIGLLIAIAGLLVGLLRR